MSRTVIGRTPVALDVVALAAFVLMLHFFRAILWPLALAVVIAILVRALQRSLSRLWPALNGRVLAVGAGAGAVAALGWTVLMILPNAAELGANAPQVLVRLDRVLAQASAALGLDDPLTVNNLVGSAEVRRSATSLLGVLRDAASGLVLTAVFVVFLLAMWPRIERRVLAVSRGGRGRGARLVVARAMSGVEGYLWIQAVTGLVNASAAALVMFSVGLNDWLLWSAGLFILSFIPFLGVAVGSIAPALAALLQFPGAGPALIVFGVIQLVAFLVGNFLTPKLQADRQNLDPAAGLFAVGAWTLLWGLPGAFLAIPLTLAIVYQLAMSPRFHWIAVLLSHDGLPARTPPR